MDFSPKTNSITESSSLDTSLSIKEILEKYLKNWIWFLISVLLITCYSLYKLNFIRPQYRASATIKVKNEDENDKSTLAAFKDLSILSGNNDNIEDQIEILKSKSLISEVIKELNFNVRFFTHKNNISKFLDDNFGLESNFYEVENYIDPPLKLNFFIPDSVLHATNKNFKIKVNSPSEFVYIDVDNGTEQKYTFGDKIETAIGDIIITPNVDLKNKKLIGQEIVINILSVKNLSRLYVNLLSIEPMSDFSSILNLTVTDGVIKKAEDFLNTLVQKYNERAIQQKEQLTQNTSEIVTRRLEIISSELSNVDLSAESLKTRYRISDVGSGIDLSMQSSQEIERQISYANAELQKIDYLKDIVSTNNSNDFIAPNIGISDNNLSSTFQRYNDLMQQKKKFLESSTEKNPIVVNINDQLKDLKENISIGLDNLESAQKISLQSLNEQNAKISSKIYSAPKQERQIRDVQRQQQIKEALYLYLLQKREETAITLGIADPNAEVIDRAEGYGPVSPKKHLFYFASVLIGLFIPFIIIYTRDFLNSKIKSRQEVEKILNIPILGDIPKFESKKNFLITKEDHSSVAEAFRILRTNLNFILNNDKKSKVIFVTSTIAHEGKSLISSNLATSLALAGKKTLLLGMDIRAPKIKSYIGLRGKKGVTNFIIEKSLTLNDIVIEIPKIKNLDLISSGDIPPNPAELLLNDRVSLLFNQIKDKYEYVIVDTAASSIITDTMIIKDYADAFLYIVRVNYLDKRQLAHLKDIYTNRRYNNLALVLNGVDHKKGYGYGYGYGVNYEKNIKKRKWWKLS